MQLTLKRIPAGTFVMGDQNGDNDEFPLSKVAIKESFWMADQEITNAQYAQFDPAHDSGHYDQHWKDHTRPGYPANLPNQPVIRVSWTEAMEFCRWLSDQTGKHFTLPTEAQWEWACRAGSGTPLWFGDTDKDFSEFANLADSNLSKMAVVGVDPQPRKNPDDIYAYIPRVRPVDDGTMLAGEVGAYKPNPWGLLDMHGSVCEWTRSSYRSYPYMEDGRNQWTLVEDKVARGGSWRDRPKRARSGFRLGFKPYQKVYNVGFRVIMVEENQRVVQTNE
jgi:formylglycine-generating enzyme required for sulfatase activity